MIGLDTAKSVFQVHAVNESGKVEIRRKLQRSELIPFFEKREACTVILVLLQRWRLMKGELGGDPDQVTLRGDIEQAGDEAGLASDVASADVPNLPFPDNRDGLIVRSDRKRELPKTHRHDRRDGNQGLAFDWRKKGLTSLSRGFGVRMPLGHLYPLQLSAFDIEDEPPDLEIAGVQPRSNPREAL